MTGRGSTRTRVSALVAVLATLLVAGLSGASPAAAQESPTSLYIRSVYLDLFGREPDPTGMATWTAAINSGTPRVAVANAITHSEEFRTGLITETYLYYLGREPDAQGLRFWLDQMARGWTISQISAGFLASDEYYAQAGSNAFPWIQSLYADVLGRSASIAEVSSWSKVLIMGGGSRAKVSLGFLLSEEHLTPIVDGYYQHLLGRGIDPTGKATWVGRLQAGAYDEDIIGGIIASDEYWMLATG
jgi:hypothetical protein